MGNLTPGNGATSPYLTGSQVYALAVNAGFSQTPQYTININGQNQLYSQAEVATAIAKAESGWNANNEGDQSLAAYGSNGLWQIFSGAHAPSEFGLSGAWSPGNVAAIDVPQTNADAAFEVFKSQGFNAWSTYKSGAYLQYLPAAQSASNGPNPYITVSTAQQQAAASAGGSGSTITSAQAGAAGGLSLDLISDAFANFAKLSLRIGYGLVGVVLCLFALYLVGREG